MQTSIALSASSARLPSLAQIRAEKERRAADRERERLARDGEAIRARCTSLAGFVREAWAVLEPAAPYIHGWHIDAICAHLEAITLGRMTPRLLINVPPGTMKSLLVSVLWPAWEWGPCGLPAMRYVATSYSEKFVKRDSRRMRDLVSSEWYRSLWPEIELSRAGEISFANTRTGFREGMAFGSLTGARGDRVIIDDPHSTETAESEAERETTTRIFRESVPTRVNNPERSAIVVVMQRLHEKDVSGVIERLGLPYERLILPMEFEPERRCRTSLGFEDPRTYAGELLFPERFPRDVVERDKVPMGSYAVAGQFQQRPTPREGGLFKREWFDVVPAPPAVRKIVRGWDLAATSAKGKTASGGPAYTAGVRLSWAAGTFYIEHVARAQAGPADVDRLLRNTADQDPPGTRISIPQDPGQAAKGQVLAFARLLAGKDVRFSPETGSKEQRAVPVSAQAEAGNIKIVAGPWNDAFLDELGLFPNGSHKDQVDALSRAFGELLAMTRVPDVPHVAPIQVY
jgi:predicted phage terminase large subunit-like protein